MILQMTRIRLLGPRPLLEETVETLQDLGTVHLVVTETTSDLLEAPVTDRSRQTEIRMAASALADIDSVVHHLPINTRFPVVPEVGRSEIACWARRSRRFRREVESLESRIRQIEEEQALLSKYRELLTAFRALFERAEVPGESATFCLTLPKGHEDTIEMLQREIGGDLGEPFDLRVRELPNGDSALLLVVPPAAAEHIETLMSEARVEEVPVPEEYRTTTVAEALPQMHSRLEAIPGYLTTLRGEVEHAAAAVGDDLLRARAALNDLLLTDEARKLARVTPHAFVVEGWVPDRDTSQLRTQISARFGEDTVIELVETAEWEDSSAPVVLSNPRLLRPFEPIVKFLPLPHYGSIDPTPFVAFFFPVFFGVILGDAGYGLILIILALLVRRRSKPETTLRSVTHIALVCGVFAIVFGVVFGEVFGDLGHRTLGLEPLWFRREEALLPFLGLAVAIGLVHVVLGLALGAVAAFRRQPRHALGRGLSALVVVLIFLAILAAAEILPEGFFTPAAVAILALFPVLVFAEGIIAPIEILAALSNIFSYARVMALGTASVMMAIVANRMAGAMGSAVVGVLFALLFHLVNFVLGVFSPTIHSLRLHYVEFFGKFYSPGGTRYQPLRHWQPVAGGSAK